MIQEADLVLFCWVLQLFRSRLASYKYWYFGGGWRNDTAGSTVAEYEVPTVYWIRTCTRTWFAAAG